MAISLRKYSLILEPRTLNADNEAKEATVKAVAEHFSVEEQELRDVIQDKPNSMYEHLDALRELSGDIVESFKKKMNEKDS